MRKQNEQQQTKPGTNIRDEKQNKIRTKTQTNQKEEERNKKNRKSIKTKNTKEKKVMQSNTSRKNYFTGNHTTWLPQTTVSCSKHYGLQDWGSGFRV